MKKMVMLGALMALWGMSAFAQDSNFHIYLCLGQSNMEGNARFEPQDTLGVDERFRVFQAVDCPDLNRRKEQWYTAVTPLVRCDTGLTPVDYFGRTMVESLPENIRVGVVCVAVAGCKIELFDQDTYQAYAADAPDWMKERIDKYGGNPYARLVELGRKAQKEGVIKGILLHQGESNTNDSIWPQKVKKVYDRLLSDLNLEPNSLPLLSGEVVNADQDGQCASMNEIIATLPEVIPNAHVISSKGCTSVEDKLHFSAEGYRELGKRYARKMLSLSGL